MSILARNICMANEIKTLEDLKQHYDKGEDFRNLRYCDEKSNDELMAVYNEYSNIYTEDETSQPVSRSGSESKLEDIVTDYDEVMKTTLTADVSFEEIEQMLKDHWEKKGIRSKPIELYVSKTTESIEELEQRLKNHWRKKASEKTSQIDKNEYFVKATSRVSSADLKKVAKRKSTFGRHTSKKLNDLYFMKSYQGINPVDAKVIFVGRDPNWAADIEETDMFGSVVEYLTDGNAFWEKHGIHHPFLIKGYKGDGRKYHRSFSRMNLDSSVANKISFVELIGFPTTGMAGSNSTLFKQYLFSKENRDHLIELDKLLSDTGKMIFIAWGLINDIKLINKRTGLFDKLAKLDKSKMDITDLNQYENIFIHRHFSDAISNATIAKMAKKVKQHFL